MKLPPFDFSLKEHKVLDVIVNIGLLTPKELTKKSKIILKYFDQKGEVLVVRKNGEDGMQYEIYKIADEELIDNLNYEQTPKLLAAIVTKDRILIDCYKPGAWETRLAKLAEEQRHEQPLAKIKRSIKV